LILRKNHTIAVIVRENADLKESLSLIDDQLLELKDTASDVRLFQRELIKVIKDLDQSYPVTFATAKKTKTALKEDSPDHTQVVLENTRENIFKLISSHESLRFKSASLLGKAIFIRDILDNTPSMRPVSGGHISDGFGLRPDPFTGKLKQHNGIDIGAHIGTPVFASADGHVIFAGENVGLGKLVKLKHKNGFETSYGHMSQFFVLFGADVKRGQVIGAVGNTGSRCKGAHLHFEIKKFGIVQDPKPFMIGSPPDLF
jgi:murein DD-endopeptidase MepM/ murein hydrolase activator NlpD